MFVQMFDPDFKKMDPDQDSHNEKKTHKKIGKQTNWLQDGWKNYTQAN